MLASKPADNREDGNVQIVKNLFQPPALREMNHVYSRQYKSVLPNKFYQYTVYLGSSQGFCVYTDYIGRITYITHKTVN